MDKKALHDKLYQLRLSLQELKMKKASNEEIEKVENECNQLKKEYRKFIVLEKMKGR